MAVPVAPDGVEGRDVRALRRQSQIADGYQTRIARRVAQIGLRQFPAPIPECVELFDIAGFKSCLRPHPVAQPKLECAVAGRIETPVRQAGGCAGFARYKRVRRLFVRRDDHRRQADDNRRRHARAGFAP